MSYKNQQQPQQMATAEDLAMGRGTTWQGIGDRVTGNLSQRRAEHMANTAYQRRVQDLRRAGLNPALAFQGAGGSPANQPGSSPSASPGDSRILSSALRLLMSLKGGG